MKIGFQLKQVRERLAKGLVDKGILRTEKRNFLLFDMATHPVADGRTKEDLNNQVISLLTTRTSTIPPQALAKDTNVKYRNARAVSLVCSAYAASVLENPLQRLSYDAKGNAISRCDDILAEFSSWPFGGSGGGSRRKREGMAAVARGSGESDNVQELVREVKKEMEDPEDACFEILAAVFEVFGKMDSLI
jgi:Golgi phosphoprotein 3